MLVVEVDVVGIEAPERGIARGMHVFGTTVDADLSLGGNFMAELRGNHYLRPRGAELGAEKFLVEVRTIDIGGVEEGHSEV